MPALVLALVRSHLAGGGEGEAAAGANAVEVVGGLAVHAALVLALLVLVELLEAILGIGVVLDVVALVLLDVTFVLEGECAAGTPAVEVCGLLPIELAVGCATVLSGWKRWKPSLMSWVFFLWKFS